MQRKDRLDAIIPENFIFTHCRGACACEQSHFMASPGHGFAHTQHLNAVGLA